MAYVKPQVLLEQEFALVPTEITDPLRAHISGPHADLHRYTDADEKATINLGAYDRLLETEYPWPGRTAGSLVDLDYVRLYLDDALLMYLEDTIGSGSLVTAVSGRTNWVQSDELSFKTNGVAYPRSAELLDRDAKLGDTVYLRSADVELWTYISGFASEPVDSELGVASADDNNQPDTTASISIEKTGGADNCVSAAVVDPSAYDGLVDGDVEEEYTVEVIQSSVAGSTNAKLRVTSASGNDDVAEADVEDFGDETDIGTRGVKVIFSVSDAASCSVDAADADVSQDELVVGQKWVISVQQDFEKALPTAGGDYTGDVNDTIVVEVTKGGIWAELPEITVTTVKGLDFSGPTEVTDDLTAVAIGTHGLTMAFFGTGGTGSSSDASEPVAGLRKGDKYYITAIAEQAGPVRRLILKHDLPAVMLTAEDLDLRLFIKDDIEVAENREGFAPLVNWEAEATQIVVKDGIQAYHTEWTDGGVEQPLPVRGGTLFAHYREWLSAICDEIGAINDVADLGDIAGPLDPDNPLKYGVFKALENSNGTIVKYTAVCAPDDLDSWQAVLDKIKGTEGIYNLVPLTFNRLVQNLYAAHINAESSAEAGNWKGGFVAVEAVTSRAAVSATTSTDEEVVLATLADNPNASGTQYTLLSVPGANGQFVTNDVEAGDIVRFLYTTDGFGEVAYQEFVVDDVISEDSLLLANGHDVPISVAQKIEVWHSLSKNEIAADVAALAASFANRRVCVVWPDSAGSAGTDLPGYFVAASLAGEVSGVVPHQPLTNTPLLGYDDLSRSFAFFNSTQLDTLAAAGVWIVTEDKDGTVHTRHGLTSDNTDLNRREEMIRRNVDSMSYLFYNRLKPFIGRTNVSPSMVRRLRYEVGNVITFLVRSGFTDELGGQLISGTITTLQIHPLLRDRIEIVLSLVVPAPLNNIELHLVI